MSELIISGIQQIGIGVKNLEEAFAWYRKSFGVDVPAFEDVGEANLMQRYTGGKPRTRHAVLALNLQGGSGFEVWQYTGREPQGPDFSIRLGDLGIFLSRVKAREIEKAYGRFREVAEDVQGDLTTDPAGNRYFFLKDPFGNLFQIVEGQDWFSKGEKNMGGACGCLIGVSDIEESCKLYTGILGYDQVVYDESGRFDDFKPLPGGADRFRRVLLAHTESRRGLFSRLIGSSQIELVQSLDRKPRKIFEGRYWGDLGYIHVCFDISGMDVLRERCDSVGLPFTVDSAHSLDIFDMGDASGHFSYVEDPDGILVEFVESHKIPVIRKIGLSLNLKKRNPGKPLPDWIIRMLGFSRIRD